MKRKDMFLIIFAGVPYLGYFICVVQCGLCINVLKCTIVHEVLEFVVHFLPLHTKNL